MTEPKEYTTDQMIDIHAANILLLVMLGKDSINEGAKEKYDMVMEFSKEQFNFYVNLWRKGGKNE